jgi:Ger(x)C family germination protein
MRRILLSFLVISLVLITGCWDWIDIEKRGYVLGLAIDDYESISQEGSSSDQKEKGPEDKKKFEQMELHQGQPIYALTAQIPVIKNSSIISSNSVGNGQGPATWEITQAGNSFIGMNRQMQSRTNLSLYYEHLQVIIISENAARKGLENIIDFFVRDPEMRRRVRIFISKGEAKKILQVKPFIDDHAALYISSIPENARKSSRIIAKTDLGEVIKFVHGGYDFVLPMAESTENEINASGGAIFKGDKMVGWVSEVELEAIKMMRNIYIGGVLTVAIPDTENATATLEITKSKCKIKPVIEKDKLSFDLTINITGNYAEEVNYHTHGQLNEEFLKKLQKAYEREVEMMCRRTMEKLQKEYEADAIQLKKIVQKEEPEFWKINGKNWYEIYPASEIRINANVNINLVGLKK